MIMNRNCILLLLGVIASTTNAEIVPQRRYEQQIKDLKVFLHEAKRRNLASAASATKISNSGTVDAPPPTAFSGSSGTLTCEVLEEAFQLPAWGESTCTCQGNSAAKPSNFDITVSCVDNFECCSHESTEVCVTNSFQQIINKETYEAMDTTEYFHYTSGRQGTITLFHMCDTESDAGCTCSLHVDTDKCNTCNWVVCDGEQTTSFDCTNIEGGGTFDYCPSSTVSSLDISKPIGALQDGYIDYKDNCRPLPGAVVPQLGGLQNLKSKKSGATTYTAGAAVLSVVVGLFFL